MRSVENNSDRRFQKWVLFNGPRLMRTANVFIDSSGPFPTQLCEHAPIHFKIDVEWSACFHGAFFCGVETVKPVFFQGFQKGVVVELQGVNTIFLLCLILLTQFHKNASSRPNMLDYLNTTFTFGKQTKDNFINSKVQICWCIYSFIYSFSCPLFLRESRGGSSPRRTRNTSRSTKISESSAGSTPRRDQARSEM